MMVQTFKGDNTCQDRQDTKRYSSLVYCILETRVKIHFIKSKKKGCVSLQTRIICAWLGPDLNLSGTKYLYAA